MINNICVVSMYLFYYLLIEHLNYLWKKHFNYLSENKFGVKISNNENINKPVNFKFLIKAKI